MTVNLRRHGKGKTRFAEIVISGEVLELDPKKVLRADEAARREALRHWFDKFLPLHFGGDASERYGYAERLGTYLARDKYKRYGNEDVVAYFRRGVAKGDGTNTQVIDRSKTFVDSRPLFRTGNLRRTALKSKPGFGQARGGSGVAIRVRTDKSVFYRRRRSDGSYGPDKVKELTAILPQERDEMLAVYDRKLQERARRLIKQPRQSTVINSEGFVSVRDRGGNVRRATMSNPAA